ncbi:MAG: amidohydrolase [Clostridia bacterium]|nr:amidohydrolase [Clostridia bacterium]
MKKLYCGGTILTMDRENPVADALLTENGRILAAGRLGDTDGIEGERVDLQGKTLMPAFVDGHSHLISTGMNLTKYCDLRGSTSIGEILERIAAFRREKGIAPTEALTCKGYDPAIMKEGRHPTAADLDALGGGPIACIHISGHVASYNTLAMERAGICERTYCCPAGGFAGRDENGRLNGYFEETARGAFSSVFSSKITGRERKQAILAAQELYLSHGFGTVQEGSANKAGSIRALAELAESDGLYLDVVAYLNGAASFRDERREILDRLGRDYRKGLKLGGVKLFLDGSPQVRTAWLRKPYEGEEEYCGYPTLTDEAVEKRLRLAVEDGFQPIAHCNGDAASEQFLSAWEKLAAQEPAAASLRPVMIHAQTVGYDQLERMAKTGMMASFFVGHCYYWGDTHLQNLGERGFRISPVKAAMERGVPFNFHQDSPVTEPNMLHSIWCAVNRRTRNGICIGQENRIGVGDALMAATVGGAYAYGEENTKGILKPGAKADFVILDRDPFAVPEDELCRIKVLSTIKEDRVLYEAKGR